MGMVVWPKVATAQSTEEMTIVAAVKAFAAMLGYIVAGAVGLHAHHSCLLCLCCHGKYCHLLCHFGLWSFGLECDWDVEGRNFQPCGHWNG